MLLRQRRPSGHQKKKEITNKKVKIGGIYLIETETLSWCHKDNERFLIICTHFNNTLTCMSKSQTSLEKHKKNSGREMDQKSEACTSQKNIGQVNITWEKKNRSRECGKPNEISVVMHRDCKLKWTTIANVSYEVHSCLRCALLVGVPSGGNAD